MSVDFADIDRDGYVDFFVVDMLSRFSQLRKRQGFAQVLSASPVGAIDELSTVVGVGDQRSDRWVHPMLTGEHPGRSA